MYRIELYQFWNNSDHLAIHCDTEEKAKKLCEALGEIGAEWNCEELFSSDATILGWNETFRNIIVC